MPFQRDATVCPLANVQVSFQLVQAVVLVLAMVRAAPKAAVLCGDIVYVTLHELPDWVPVELTVSAMVVDAVSVPEVPLMVIVEVPAAAVLLATNVTTLVPVVGLVPNVAVTPVGSPEAASVTLPLKGLISFTVMVSVPLAP